jgi:hypothetical protein
MLAHDLEAWYNFTTNGIPSHVFLENIQRARSHVTSSDRSLHCTLLAILCIIRKCCDLECRPSALSHICRKRWRSVFGQDLKFVAQIEFLEMAENDHLRHSRFVGLRDDKDPRKV